MNLAPGPWAGALRIRHLPAVNAAAFVLLALLVFLMSGCVTPADRFLVSALSDQEKARALVSAGAAAYNARLVKAARYDEVDDVAAYFDRALGYDPDNADAARYAGLVADFRANRLAAAKKEANDLLKKQKRTEAEDFAIAVAVRKTLVLDPADDEVKALLKQTAALRSGLVETFLSRAQDEMAKVPQDAGSAVKEKAWVAAYGQADKAKAVDPSSAQANKLLDLLEKELGELLKSRLILLTSLGEAKNWTEGRNQVAAAKDLNGRLGGLFGPSVAQAEHDFYLRWAKSLFEAKNYVEAGTRVDSALAAMKSAQAVELKKQITAVRAAQELGAGYESGIQNIDKAIAARDFPKAQRLIAALGATKLDAVQKKSLDDRRAKLAAAQVAASAEAYDRGVAAYKEERFKDAIAALEAVLALDPEYKDASDYLDKARTKQRVLDGF